MKLSLFKYGQSDGLPSYNIRQVLRDKKGFLWIATQEGLARFDGKTFINYTKQSVFSQRIPGADVRKLIEDTTKGILWVLSNDCLSAVSTKVGNVLHVIPTPPACKDDWNITMTNYEDQLWIGTYCGLKIYDTKKSIFQKIPDSDAVTQKHAFDFEVNCLVKDQFNNIWACYSGYGIIVYNGKNLKKLAEIKLDQLQDHLGSGMIRFNHCTKLNTNEILFATSQGLRKISYDSNYTFKVNTYPCLALQLLNNISIETIEQINANEILIAGNHHLYHFDSLLKDFVIYDERAASESKWINSVQSIYKEDKLLWLGCQQGIAFIKMVNQPFEKYFYDETTGSKLEHIRSLCALPDGDILCGLSSGLVCIKRAEGNFIIKDKQHLYHHIFLDKANRIHLSRDDGMFILQNGRILPINTVYAEFKSFETFYANSHLFLGDTSILLGTENENGILLWNYKKHTVINIHETTKPCLRSNTVNNIFQERNGNIWVLSNRSITLFDKSFKTSKVIDSVFDNHLSSPYLFFDMCETKEGYWIASYSNGIIELDHNLKVRKLITSKNGLCNEGVYNLFNIGDSALIVTSNNGLSIYNIKKEKFKNFYKDDGLHSSAFEEVAATTLHSNIYAGGIDGFTIVKPAEFTINTVPPKVYFTQAKIKTNDSTVNYDTVNLEIQDLHIPDNWLHTTILFAAINYTNPSRVTYQYRIKENDSSWTNIGNQNSINIFSQKPGTYTLEIKAANEDGYWSEPRKILLTFKPKWYQTWWFYTLLTLAVASILYAFFRYRINQIRKQHQIRKDIASDLHDDIGSSLNTVKIFTHLAKKEQDKEPYLNEIESSLTSATTGLRDMLWVLDDAQDTAFELVERIRKFVLPVLEASNIRLDTRIEADERKPLSKVEKKNLYLIAKESINNSIKYADCKNISLHVHQTNGKTALLIQDDGKGFDASKQTEGNGLKNIRERARQIRYLVDISSSSGEGTTIKLTKK